MDAARRSALVETMTKMRGRIDHIRERNQGIGEHDTKATLIEPVLSALGWQLDELDEVRREYRRKPQDNPVDYALFILRQPRLFVEAKSLDTTLDPRKCASQVLGYASVVGVGWCLVTDGNEYRLYNAHAAVDVEDKLFRRVRIADESQTEYCLETLGLLAKETMGENVLEMLWKGQFIDRRVQKALEELFLNEDGALGKLVRRKTPEIAPADIRDSLKRADLRVSYPVLAARTVSSATAEPPKITTGKVSGSGGARITLKDLITAGLISPPLALGATYKGQTVEAVVEPNGSVQYDGKSYGTLSAAGGAAKAYVNGSPDGPFPATNGWTFWQYRDAQGELRVIDGLQKQFADMKA